MNRTLVRRALLPFAAVAVFALAGCGGDEDTGSGMDHGSDTSTAGGTSSQTFNDADVTFAQNMIAHHQQAVEMADLAASRAASTEVKTLATQIKAAQQPEIDTMTAWCKAWGKPTVPAGGHDGHSMPGMMSTQDMDTLKAARGAAFDKQFAQMMIDHHTGAIQMAQEVQKNGSNPEVKKLAADIEKVQQAEIASLKKVLGQS
ncbi:DUF305 domain-containing protein [Virgisporangium aurantiacum]|uniref:Lipoprotein n=1 Tax=Virgisporangium aurantiacum TaxID=175570 RepID=A0A8J3ZGB5_9ACTN|nr:DUF305 domain-containing protein [Virgisporangium aurantiacum]GIJ63346.1 lipoprotein [Virgisporangium aurantiacum]